jgi:hypothetical protein
MINSVTRAGSSVAIRVDIAIMPSGNQ